MGILRHFIHIVSATTILVAGAPASAAGPEAEGIAPPGADASPSAPAEALATEMPAVALGDDEERWDDDDDWDDWEDEFDAVPSGYPDPLEPMNRAFMSFNNVIDALVLDPVTRLYRFVLPDFSRSAIVRLFDNVNSPQVIVNDSLQLEWKDAGIATSRLLVNTVLGLGGLLDPAERFGLEPHMSDFGQTLTIAGVQPGLYFVLPLLGPSSARGVVGLAVDSFLHPTFYLLGGTDLLIFGGSAGLTTRARHYEEIKALKESSVDLYSALRSGYYQSREAEIWSRREDRRRPQP